jgi:hypothetical protein
MPAIKKKQRVARKERERVEQTLASEKRETLTNPSDA